jgi:PAS domain S-box-containing protein
MAEKTVVELLDELRAMREQLEQQRDSEDARRRAEDALHRSEVRFRDLVEQSLGLICTHDLDGVLLSINPAAAHALGYDPDEGIGVNLREFLSPSTRHLFDKYLQRIRQNTIDTGLMRVVTKDGAERIWMYRNVRITDASTAPHVVGHALDITDRIRAEEALRASEQNLKRAHDDLERRVQERTAQLRDANDRLRAEASSRQQAERDRVELLRRERQAREDAETANRLKDEFLAAVSHELRTPLTVILGWVRLAQAGQVSADRQAELIERIGRNAETLARLVNDLLDISRLSSGRYALDLATVPVVDVLESSIESLRPSAEAKGVVIESRFRAGYRLRARGRDATAAGRLEPVVQRREVHRGRAAPCRCGPNGPTASSRFGSATPARAFPRGFCPTCSNHSVRPAPARRALTPDSAWDSPSSATSCTCMAAPFAQKARASGLGATFIVQLPAAAREPAEVKDKPERAKDGDGVRLDGVRVLVVEDDRECRELLQVILESAGAQVTSASSVRDAMDRMTKSEPDVLVSDIGMPGEDGFALIRKIRNLDGAIAKIPALALTGYEQTAGSDAVRPERFQQIAVKPIDPQELVAIVAGLAAKP